MYLTDQQSSIEVILVKHVSFDLLCNNNHLIIRYDKEDIEVTSAFLLQSFSLKYS